MITSFLINHGLFFIAGGAFVLLAQGIGKVRMQDRKLLDAFYYRLGFFCSLALLLVGTYITLGPGGWVYTDFEHYASQSFCFPANWSARIFPISTSYDYFYYSNGNVEYSKKNITDNVSIPTWLTQLNQTIPLSPTVQ